jgi:3-oxoacyl-[acyl-carrier-protein] synthase II
MRQRVAITGIGCISSFGIGHRALVNALSANRSGVRPVTEFDTSSCRAHSAATLDGFDPTAFFSPLKLRRVDAVGRLALVCARLLLEDSALPLGASGSDEVGVALGSLTAGLHSTIEYMHGLTTFGPAGAPALLFSNTVSNAPASLCAIEHGLRGPNVTFNQREASGLAAIAYAAGLIRDGRVAAMISGGVDRLEEMFFKVQAQFGPFARDEASRPFDRHRGGFVLGEAGVLFLLESAGAAAARGARVYGELLGIGMTASRAELNGWPVDSAGTARAMQIALDDAGVPAPEVDAVFAAANGSKRLDALEADAIGTVFGSRRVPVVSVKGAVGESGTAGAAALAAALLSAADGVLPPTVGFSVPDPMCPVNVSPDPRTARGPTFLVNGIASGGTSYSLVARAARHGQKIGPAFDRDAG